MNTAESALEAKGWVKRPCDGGEWMWWKRFDSSLFKCSPANRFTKRVDDYVPGIQTIVAFHKNWTEVRMIGQKNGNGKWKFESSTVSTDESVDLDEAVGHLVDIWNGKAQPQVI